MHYTHSAHRCTCSHKYTHAHHTCAQRHAHDIRTICAHTSAYTNALSHTLVRTHTCTPVCTHVLMPTEFTGWEDLTIISCCPGHSHRLLTALPTEALAPHPVHALQSTPYRARGTCSNPTPPWAPQKFPLHLGVKGEVLTIMKDAQHPINAAMLISCFSNTPGGSCPTVSSGKVWRYFRLSHLVRLLSNLVG